MFCCSPDEASNPQNKLQQKRMQLRRRRQHRYAQHHHEDRPLTPRTARKLADLDRRPTSPKRVSRDGGGGSTFGRGRIRLDSEGKSKSKSQPASRTPSKEKIKFQHGDKNLHKDKEDGNGPVRIHSPPGHGDHGFSKQTRYAESATARSLRETSTLRSSSPASAFASPRYLSHTLSKGETAVRTESGFQTNPTLMHCDHRQRQGVQITSHHRQDQSHNPLYGILKDNNSGHQQTVGINYTLGGAHHDVKEHRRENPYIHSARSSTTGGSNEPLYQPTYTPLSRSSRSETPENAYTYGALSARTNPGPHSYHNAIYSDNPSHWKPGSRKAASESGFSVGSIERENIDNNYAVINYKKRSQKVVDHNNKNYVADSGNCQPQRPESVPPVRKTSPDSLYNVIRPGSVAAQYYSDSETGVYQRSSRTRSRYGQYEQSSTIRSVTGSDHRQNENIQHDQETSSVYGTSSSASQRAEAHGKQNRNGPGKRPLPRRHTLCAGAGRKEKPQETEKKREAFMQLLAHRYPQYADKIHGTDSPPASESGQQDKPARARDVQRRRTAAITYNPSQATNILEYDDLGTMSDLELPSFQKGGFMRTSLPIVRSASTSLERPLGLVFLVYGDQTKKSMLPNEITTLDTVRALFVQAFPNLTMEMLENPRRKIYLLDPATNIYFQLEDLMDIKDRSVLKIHETDSDQPQRVKVRQEVRGRTVQMPISRPHPEQVYAELPVGHEVEQRNMWEFERRSRSRTPELGERPRSLSAGASSRQRFSHSPDRLPTPERAPLNPIPENRQLIPGYRDQGNYYETIGPETYRGQYSGIYESSATYQGYPPSSPIPPQHTYIARSTRAPSLAHPQRAVGPGHEIRESSRGNNANRHSLAFAPMSLPQAAVTDPGFHQSHNYRVSAAERDGPELLHSATPADDMTRNRIEKMEQQLANLTAWVHYRKDGSRQESAPQSVGSISDGSETLPASSASSSSDFHDGSSNQRSSTLSSRESTPQIVPIEISAKLAQLKSDLHVLRRQQQLNLEAMREEFVATLAKIKKVLISIPVAQNQVNFHKRNEATRAKINYINDKEKVERELSDLEASVEELRADVISRQCRVNTSDVEAMALLLSNITKSLADLKALFPEVQTLMKVVMDAELRIIVSEEKFLREEPTEIEHCLKRCKKITGTLYTLKRLASVQDHRQPHVPNMVIPTGESLNDQKKAVLENIRSLVPDHEQRVKEMEAAEASRERKKKISSQQEALKFGKSLEMAAKNLRPPSLTDLRGETNEGEEQANTGHKNGREGQADHGRHDILGRPEVSSLGTENHQLSATTALTKPSSLAPSTVVKSSLPTVSSLVKPSDKPTATVSAMTAGVSDTITMMATKTSEKASASSIPLTRTTDCFVGAALGRTGTMTYSVTVGTENPHKKDATVHADIGSINPVFPVSSSVFSHGIMDECKLNDLHCITSQPELINRNTHLPTDLSVTKADFNNKGMIMTLDPYASEVNNASPSHTGFSDNSDKVDTVVHRQTVRNAFFSSMNTPPDSPLSSPTSRIAAGFEVGPTLSPTGRKVTQLPNVGLAGGLSSRSGSVVVSVPGETTENKTTSPQNAAARGIPRPVSEGRSPSHDNHMITSSESGKQRKIPPPPPPRKDSRPMSANISPVNGAPLDFSLQQSQDLPRFVGGILGQHRLSGGPLSSTPKPTQQQKPVAVHEPNIATSVYANMNPPDLQSKSSSQYVTGQAHIPSNSHKDPPHSNTRNQDMSIPPPPSVTIALDREERAGSSESSSSSSSSSGASMGSQQSVISVIKSPSIADKGFNKAKPDPPKRQSSLLSKLTGSKDSKSKQNGKAKFNGVDL